MTHKYITTKTIERLHYLEFGRGDPVVLIPSLWVTSKSYAALGRELGKFYHVFIPDIFRGLSGFSRQATTIDDYVTALSEFISRLHLKQHHLIGISLSGITVMKYLLRGYSLPKKVFLVSTTVVPLNYKMERFTLLWGYFMLLYHNAFSWDGIASNYLWITDGLSYAWRHFGQAWQEGLIATSLAIDDIKSLPVPSKLLFALRDEFLKKELTGRLSKVKNMQLETINCYHAWFFRREKELVQNIRAFFNADD